MADSFKDDFRHPNFKGSNPFSDDVQDPDEVVEASPADGSPVESRADGAYAASSNPGYVNPEYAVSTSDRSVSSIVFSSFALLTLMVGLASMGNGLCLPMPICALAMSVPAWLLSRNDFKAVTAGAIRSDRRGRVMFAMFFGALAALVSFVTFLLSLWQMGLLGLGK